MISAICLEQILATLTYERGTDIHAFMTKMLVPVLWAGAIVLMDNLNVHLNEKVKEAIESVGAKVLFLPKYSPELSPIEFLWSKIKEVVRSRQPRQQFSLWKMRSLKPLYKETLTIVYKSVNR